MNMITLLPPLLKFSKWFITNLCLL